MENVIQIQGDQRVPIKMSQKRPTPRHIIIKCQNLDKEKNLKSSKSKRVTYKGAPIRLSTDFSVETCQARRE